MACGMLPIRPVVVRACINTADDRRLEVVRKGTSRKWWAPLFGFPSEPDYINPDANLSKPGKLRFEPGCFTEEKAKKFRRMTTDAASFHDAMYHSAIASRLASDFPDLVAP